MIQMTMWDFILSRPNKRAKSWTHQDTLLLEELKLEKDLTFKEIAKKMGFSVNTIRKRAVSFGLHSPREYNRCTDREGYLRMLRRYPDE